MLTAPRTRARALVDARRDADADRRDVGRPSARAPSRRSPRAAPPATSTGVGAVERPLDVPVAVDETGVDLRPAEVDPDDARAGQGGGYPTSPDGAGREALPRLSRRSGQGQGPGADEAASAAEPASDGADARLDRRAAARRRRSGASGCRGAASWKRALAIGVLVLPRARRRCGRCTSYLAVRERRRGGERAARAGDARRAHEAGRAAALAPDDDPAARHRLAPTAGPQRATGTPTRSCSCAPIRRTTGIAYLSIPRDLLVPVPGLGDAKINAALPGRRRAARDQDDPRVHRARRSTTSSSSTSPTSRS